jgi:hypothetical protein
LNADRTKKGLNTKAQRYGPIPEVAEAWLSRYEAGTFDKNCGKQKKTLQPDLICRIEGKYRNSEALRVPERNSAGVRLRTP